MRNTLLIRMVLLLSVVAMASAQEQPQPGKPAEEPAAEKADTPKEPKPELERPTVWGEPTEVRVAIYMIDVDEVDSAEQSFAASVYYEAHWDIPFLRHKGPGSLNRRLTEVWTPRLAIVNQQMAWAAFPGSVEIQPNGEVAYRQKVWGRFSQPLDLRDFPLDRQVLTVHLVAAGHLENVVKMLHLVKEGGRGSGIASAFSLPDFDVVSWKAGPAPYSPYEGKTGVAGFKMEIEVRRRFGYYVMKVIIPLCLIVIMSWAPRWIDPEQMGTNMGVSATAFLTLVAYFFAIGMLLPRVSYVTRMDRFILLSMLMVFTGLLHTCVDCALVKRKRTAAVERIARWSRFVYPVLLLVVMVVSFLL